VRLRHDIWLFGIVFLGHVLWVLLLFFLLHVHLIIAFVAPKVFAAGKLFSEQTQHRKDHVGSHLASYALEFRQVYMSLVSKRHVKD